MKNVIAYIAFVLLSACHAFAQPNKPVTLKEPAALLKTFFGQHEIEKAHLHFDKPYYAAGDTIYFKAYVVAGEKNELSQLSGVLHADLINPQSEIVKSISLQLNNGLAWGDFSLPDSVAGGNYRVRAYTKFMQNYGSELFFDRQIPVAALFTAPQKQADARLKSPAPAIQFFPEGGELITTVMAKVAFKAINADGLGVDVKGVVLDQRNKAVATFAAAHLGMGAFEFTPLDGDKYRAELTYADGTKNTVDLPAANSLGVAMAVIDSGANITVRVTPGSLFYKQNFKKPLDLLIYTDGKLMAASGVMDAKELRFTIQKKEMRSGIAQITLISPTGEPLCERLLFINTGDNALLQIASDKGSYQTREKVKVKLSLNGQKTVSVPGHFSVAVIDKSKVYIDEDKEENILTNLLLTSSLKGFIEKPGYYFNQVNGEKLKHLDLVMLTHGYRRFSWKNLVNNDLPPVVVLPEKGLTVAGMAKTPSGKPGAVTLLPASGAALMSQQTDENGNFSFNNLVFYDTTRFVLNAANKKDGKNTQLVYQPYKPAAVTSPVFYTSTDTLPAGILRAYLDNSKSRYNKYLKYNRGIPLKEVKVKSYKASYRTQSLVGAGNADQVLFGKDLIPGDLANALNGRLRGGVRFTRDGYPTSRIDTGAVLLVVIDGTITGQPLTSVNVNDVETVELLSPMTSRGTAYGMQGGHGVLIITTKNGNGSPNTISSRGVLPLTLTGFYKAKEFYAPVYVHAASNGADLRSTIYWQPEITTDANGNASFEFYNADGKGEYEIIIEGITAEGLASVAKYVYKVK
jgi:hypothetical protein